MKQELITYFAYGVNLDKEGMFRRCPGCEPLSRAMLLDHKLVFRGVADVESCEGETVQGALYHISSQHLKSLDQFEGYPKRYIRKEMKVLLEDGSEVMATLYQMTGRRHYSPPAWSYWNTILKGCRSWGISEEYIHRLIKAASKSHMEG